MVINQITTSITVVPFVAMPSTPTPMVVEVMHKQTKVSVTGTITPTYSNSRATLNLPSLVNIQNVSDQGDELVVSVTLNGVLYFRCMAYWIFGSYNPYTEWKDWDTTATQTNQFITL